MDRVRVVGVAVRSVVPYPDAFSQRYHATVEVFGRANANVLGRSIGLEPERGEPGLVLFDNGGNPMTTFGRLLEVLRVIGQYGLDPIKVETIGPGVYVALRSADFDKLLDEDEGTPPAGYTLHKLGDPEGDQIRGYDVRFAREGGAMLSWVDLKPSAADRAYEELRVLERQTVERIRAGLGVPGDLLNAPVRTPAEQGQAEELAALAGSPGVGTETVVQSGRPKDASAYGLIWDDKKHAYVAADGRELRRSQFDAMTDGDLVDWCHTHPSRG